MSSTSGCALRPEVKHIREKSSTLDGQPKHMKPMSTIVNPIEVEVQEPTVVACPDCSCGMNTIRRRLCGGWTGVLSCLLVAAGLLGLAYITWWNVTSTPPSVEIQLTLAHAELQDIAMHESFGQRHQLDTPSDEDLLKDILDKSLTTLLDYDAYVKTLDVSMKSGELICIDDLVEADIDFLGKGLVCLIDCVDNPSASCNTSALFDCQCVADPVQRQVTAIVEGPAVYLTEEIYIRALAFFGNPTRATLFLSSFLTPFSSWLSSKILPEVVDVRRLDLRTEVPIYILTSNVRLLNSSWDGSNTTEADCTDFETCSSFEDCNVNTSRIAPVFDSCILGGFCVLDWRDCFRSCTDQYAFGSLSCEDPLKNVLNLSLTGSTETYYYLATV